MSVEKTENIELLRFITCGSVDDGKSTLIGRLLYDSKSLLQDQIDAVTTETEDGSEINLANLTDGLKAEREQGITIDVAYRYFQTPKRRFIIADTPGHIQYTRNMVTGASTANLAIILIDARNGVTEQTRRHAYITSLLRIPHLVVAVNKMDLVDYSEDVFNNIKKEFTSLASHLSTRDIKFFPMSALNGDNVVKWSPKMPWYHGEALLEHLETVYIAGDRNLGEPRFPVQYVIRPRDDDHHDFRGYAGQIAGGSFRVGDEVKVIPSGKTSKIKEIYTLDGALDVAQVPKSVTLLLEDDVDISRGDMIVRSDEIPNVGNELRAQICWMAEEPLQLGRKYFIKRCARTTKVMFSSVDSKVNIQTYEEDTSADSLSLNEIGSVTFKTAEQIPYDAYKDNRYTGGFVIIDEASNLTVGAGMLSSPKKHVPVPEHEDYMI